MNAKFQSLRFVIHEIREASFVQVSAPWIWLAFALSLYADEYTRLRAFFFPCAAAIMFTQRSGPPDDNAISFLERLRIISKSWRPFLKVAKFLFITFLFYNACATAFR